MFPLSPWLFPCLPPAGELSICLLFWKGMPEQKVTLRNLIKFISLAFSRASSHLEENTMNQSQYSLQRDEQRFLILNVGEIQRGHETWGASCSNGMGRGQRTRELSLQVGQGEDMGVCPWVLPGWRGGETRASAYHQLMRSLSAMWHSPAQQMGLVPENTAVSQGSELYPYSKFPPRSLTQRDTGVLKRPLQMGSSG